MFSNDSMGLVYLLLAILLAIAVAMLLFIMFRAFVLWYWKVDRIVLLLEELVRLNDSSLSHRIVGVPSSVSPSDHTPSATSTSSPGTSSSTEPQLLALLQKAESLGQGGKLEEAAQVLEQALTINSTWAAQVAGYPRQTAVQEQPVSGYALLVHLAGKTGKKALAAQYFKRMLEVNPKDPGHARQAAREAKIVKDAREIAREMGVSFGFWEY